MSITARMLKSSGSSPTVGTDQIATSLKASCIPIITDIAAGSSQVFKSPVFLLRVENWDLI
jgi:hypothetical protein